MPKNTDPPLPVVRIGEIPCEDHPRRWLVEALWGASSVGVIGGAPKCLKTWLGLDLALSVATGTAVPGQVRRPRTGPRPRLPRRGRPAGRPPARRGHGRAPRLGASRGPDPRDHRPHAPAGPRPRPPATLRDRPAAAATAAPVGSAGAVARPRRERRRRSGRAVGLHPRPAAGTRPVGDPRPPHAEERGRGRGRRPNPSRLRRPPRLRRLEPLPPPHQGPPDLVQRTPGRPRFAPGVPPTGCATTPRRPTWRSLRTSQPPRHNPAFPTRCSHF